MTTGTFADRIRWKTLSAALAPALVGFGVALRSGGPISFLPFLCCGPSAFLIQIGTNLVNDAFDYRSGVDGPKRMGPKRVTSQKNSVRFYFAGISCFALALFLSLPAIILRGVTLLAVEIICCIAGYLYTGGPRPLGYIALGDVTVFLFFGLMATSAARFVLQGGSLLDWRSLVAGGQVGCNAVNLLAVNNLRDIEQDISAGKRTLSNLLGYKKGRWQLLLTTSGAYLIGLVWLQSGSPFAFFLPLLTLPLTLPLMSRILSTPPSPAYNLFLAQFSLLHVLFSSALMVGLCLSRLFDQF